MTIQEQVRRLPPAKFAFITRHAPTAEQAALAAERNIELCLVGDRDAFALSPADFKDYAGVIVVHPAAALRLISSMLAVGIFENANRAEEGKPPTFYAKRLHLFESHRDENGIPVIRHYISRTEVEDCNPSDITPVDIKFHHIPE